MKVNKFVCMQHAHIILILQRTQYFHLQMLSYITLFKGMIKKKRYDKGIYIQYLGMDKLVVK